MRENNWMPVKHAKVELMPSQQLTLNSDLGLICATWSYLAGRDVMLKRIKIPI